MASWPSLTHSAFDAVFLHNGIQMRAETMRTLPMQFVNIAEFDDTPSVERAAIGCRARAINLRASLWRMCSINARMILVAFAIDLFGAAARMFSLWNCSVPAITL